MLGMGLGIIGKNLMKNLSIENINRFNKKQFYKYRVDVHSSGESQFCSPVKLKKVDLSPSCIVAFKYVFCSIRLKKKIRIKHSQTKNKENDFRKNVF